MIEPKRFFGTARNIGEGGSLTIIAMDAIEFLHEKLRSTKTNSEFFDSMNV
jgi:transcription termination factor Rho